MRYPRLNFEPFFCFSHRPRLIYAPGVRRELGYELGQLGGLRPAVFTDPGVLEAGVAELVLAAAREEGVAVAGVFADILQDARLDVINEGAAFYRSSGADSLIAVGGGSVMDTAKAINIMIGQDEEDFHNLAYQAALWEGAKALPPHLAFPTTAGTGCEVTTALVVLDGEAKVKLSVTHPYCSSDIAFLDPELTVELPPRITAFTGMDALTHAIEGITSRGAQPVSDALGLHAIRLIFTYLPLAVREPGNIEARGHMQIAAALAGMCFGNTMTGAVHATAHALGARLGIPHGLANALMLVTVMEFNLSEVPERYRLIASAMGLETEDLTPFEAAGKAIEGVKTLKEEIGLKDTLKSAGFSGGEEELQALVELASGDGQIGYNPRYLEDEEIRKLYLNALK